MVSCASWIFWRPIDPAVQREINKNDAIYHNIQHFMELAKKLPNCIRYAGFNVIGDPCYYGVNLLISSKKYPNLLARIDMTDVNESPGVVEFVYYINNNLNASFTLTTIQFFDLIKYYRKDGKLCTEEAFDKIVQMTTKQLGVTPIPYKFKYISDTFHHDFSKEELNFEIQHEIKWCYIKDGDLEIEDMKLSQMQYYALKLFTGD